MHLLKIAAAVLMLLAGVALSIALSVWNDGGRVPEPSPQPHGVQRDRTQAEAPKTGPPPDSRTASDEPGAASAWSAETHPGEASPTGARAESPDASGRRAGSAPSADEKPATEPESLAPGDSSVRIVLEDPFGERVEGARIALSSEGRTRETSTGPRGEALFSELAAGSYSYRVHPPDGPPLSSAVDLVLQEREERVVTLQLPVLDLAIAGRILNQRGEPVRGVEVVATRYVAARSDRELVPVDRRETSARSRPDGSYEIRGLEEGPYTLRTAETDRYPSVTALVQAGVDSADLVVEEGRVVRVHGTVTDTRGVPLEGVGVIPMGRGPSGARTDERGRYELRLTAAGSDAIPYIDFVLSGYHSLRLGPHSVADGITELPLDARMEEAGEKFEIPGRLRSSYGDPIQGERVRLYSPRLRTQLFAVSDPAGEFVFPRVEASQDYHLSVRPQGGYADYTRSPLSVTGGGQFLEISLEPLASGALTGRMIDPQGSPLSDLRLWLVSDRASERPRPISSDAGGYFSLEDVPEGELHFETRAAPHLRVRGLRMQPGDELDVTIVLDWGDHEVHGRVVDTLGVPIGGADVYMSWTHQSGGLASSSVRRTATDGSGWFRFTQVGPGAHMVNVRAPGYGMVRTPYDVQGDSIPLEVRLEPSG